MMENYKTIDIQQLEVTPQDADNTYLGIDENGNLIRTKIEVNPSDIDIDLTGYATEKWVKQQNYANKSDIVTPDMGATVNEKGHINNRTHYIREYNTLKFHKTDNNKWLSDDIEDVSLLYILPFKDNESKYVTLTEKDIIDNKCFLSSGDGYYTVIGSYPYYIEFVGSDTVGKQLEVGVKYAWIHPDLIEPLNEAFIPDTIARTEDVDALWDETLAIWENVDGIEEKLNNLEIGDVDFSDYYTKTEIDTKLDELVIGDADVDLSNYYTKQEVDDIVDGIDVPVVDLDNYYTKSETDNLIDNVEVDLTGYATEEWVKQQNYTTDDDLKLKQNIIQDLDDIRSGATLGATALQSIPSEYITESELETRLENIGGGESGGAGSTIIELSGSKPTEEEFNTLYNSASAGKPSYVKYNDGMFAIVADYNSITNRGLYHFYYDAFSMYIVFWYTQTGNSTINEVKSEIGNISDGVKAFVMSSKDDIKIYNPSKYTNLPLYFADYSMNITAPISTYKDKSATFLLDGKMYYFDEVNGEKDGIYVKPTIVDLLNISGSGDADLSDYYTKTEIDGMIGDINNILETI